MSGSQTIRIPQQVTESFKRGRFTEPSTGCRDPQKAAQGPGGWRQEEVAEPREWPREQRREPRPEPGDGGRAEGLQPPAESHSQPTARWQDVNTPPLTRLTSSPASHSREPAPTGSWRAGRPQGQRGDARPGLDAGGRRRHPTRCPFSLLLSPPHVFPAFSPSERLVQLSFHLMPACSSSLPPPLPESSVAKGDAETRNKERWFSSFLCVRSFKNQGESLGTRIKY